MRAAQLSISNTGIKIYGIIYPWYYISTFHLFEKITHINSNTTAARECNFVMGTNFAKWFSKIVPMAKLDIYG